MASAAVNRVLARLKDHRRNQPLGDMRTAFARDPDRFSRFSARFDDLLLDYSKCAVDDTAMKLLFELAKAAKVEALREQLFAGEAINFTEGRAVLHTALRSPSGTIVTAGGHNVVPEVSEVLSRMADFATGLRSGSITGHGGRPFRDVVNIGIGGSDLGPAMATLALAPYHDGPPLHFVSNVDGAHLADTVKPLDPATTLFIVASKTFTTLETMANARAARAWVASALGEAAVPTHFAAVSTALDKVGAFGISADRIFGFWDWVGGRYSLWSAIGLPLMIAIGPENFREFLSGGHAIDRHFRHAAPENNLPLLYALIGIWHRNVCGYGTRAIIPYDQRLARLPAYLQQLDMESNGKRVTGEGKVSRVATGPVVWGEPGTNGQHAFFQLLHQGTDVIPVEFMIAAEGHEPHLRSQHQMLMANCLAQSEALMRGRTLEEATAQLLAMGRKKSEARRLAPHRVFPGNRPSITIAYRKLDPFTLGRLIALYEHRVFCEAAIWDINAFDQWGVELGKELATALQPVVEGKEPVGDRDSSTAGLVRHLCEGASGPA
jgi:glucose-6-phosphate isomerase